MSTDEKIQFFRKKGNICFKNKNFSSAINYYKKGLEYDGKNAHLNSNLAQAFLEECEFESAEYHALIAIGSTNNSSVKGYFRAAKAAAAQGKIARAVKYLKEGIENCCDTEDLQNYLKTLTAETPRSMQGTKMDEIALTEDVPPPLVSDSDSECDIYNNSSNDKLRSQSTSRMTTSSSNFKSAKDVNQRSVSMSRSCDSSRGTKIDKKTKKTRGPLELDDIFRDPFLNTLENIKRERKLPQMTADEMWATKRKELQLLLKEGSEVLASGLSRKAVEKYKAALDMILEFSHEIFKLKEIDVIVIKYGLSVGWIELANYADIAKAVEYLEDIEKNRASKFPAVFYGLGSAYYKLNRYKVATEHLEKGLLFLSRHVKFEVHSWPGTNNIISETTRNGLEELLKELNKTCRAYHEPDAICRYSDCLNISSHIVPSEQIFYSDPDFCGFVIVICEEKCRIEYHLGCWKEYKEATTSNKIGKLSDKDFIGRHCPTTDCVTQSNERSVIIKIEIVGDDTTIKASIEAPKIDANVKESKKCKKKKNDKNADVIPQNKQKVKSRPKNKKPVPETIQLPVQDTQIINSAEELDTRLEKLKNLRDVNFGYTEDNLWCPQRKFYGRIDIENLDHFLSPEYIDDSEAIRAKKDFLFSYFYEYIRSEGPQKLKDVEQKWQNEAGDFKGVKEFMNTHNNVCSFLLQSYRFASVDDYICLAEQLPEAYSLAKTELTESLSFTLIGRTNCTTPLSSGKALSNSGLQVENYTRENVNICKAISSTEGYSKLVSNSAVLTNSDDKLSINVCSESLDIGIPLPSGDMPDEVDDIGDEDPDIDINEDNIPRSKKEHLVSVSETGKIDSFHSDDDDDDDDDLVESSDDSSDDAINKYNVVVEQGKNQTKNKHYNEEEEGGEEEEIGEKNIYEKENGNNENGHTGKESYKNSGLGNEKEIDNKEEDNGKNLNPDADEYKPSTKEEDIDVDVQARGDMEPRIPVQLTQSDLMEIHTTAADALLPSHSTFSESKTWSLEDDQTKVGSVQQMTEAHTHSTFVVAPVSSPSVSSYMTSFVEVSPEDASVQHSVDVTDTAIQTEDLRNFEEEINILGITVKKLEKEVEEIGNLQSNIEELEKELIKEKKEKEALKKELIKIKQEKETLKMSSESKLAEQDKKVKEIELEMTKILKQNSEKLRIMEEKLSKKDEEFKAERTKFEKERFAREDSENNTKEMMRNLVCKTGQEVKELKGQLVQCKSDIVQYQKIVLKMRKESEEFKISVSKKKCMETLNSMLPTIKNLSSLDSPSKPAACPTELSIAVKSWEEYLDNINEHENQLDVFYRAANAKIGNITLAGLMNFEWPQLPEEPDNEPLKSLVERLIAQDKEIAKLKIDQQKTSHNIARAKEQQLKTLIEGRNEMLEKSLNDMENQLKQTKTNESNKESQSLANITSKKEEEVKEREEQAASPEEKKRKMLEHVSNQNGHMNNIYGHGSPMQMNLQAGIPLFQQTYPYVAQRSPYFYANANYPLPLPVDFGHGSASSSYCPQVSVPFMSINQPSAQLQELTNKLPGTVPAPKPVATSNSSEILGSTGQKINQSTKLQGSKQPPLQPENEVANMSVPDKKNSSTFGLTPIEKTKTVIPVTAAVSATTKPSSVPPTTAAPKAKLVPALPIPAEAQKLTSYPVPSEPRSATVPPPKPKTGSSYQKLMAQLRKNFPTKTEEELAASVAAVREKNKNSLSGLTVPTIINMVDKVLKDKASKKQGSMGLDKFGGTAWGGVRDVPSNWSKPKESSEEDCIICMEPITDEDQTSLLCKHTFHTKCIRKWLRTESMCPICRLYTRMVDEFPPLS